MDARNLLSVAGVLLVLGGVGYYWGLGHPAPLQAPTDAAQRPDYEASGIHSLETGPDGHVQRRLDAPALRHYSLPQDEVRIDTPVLHTFEAGREIWLIRAPRALSLNEGHEVRLEGGVSAERRDPANVPLHFATPQLTAWPDEERLHSSSGIRVISQQGEVSSQTLEASLKTGTVALNQNVTGTYAPARP